MKRKGRKTAAKEMSAGRNLPAAAKNPWEELARTPEGARALQTRLLTAAVYGDQVAGYVGTDNPLHDSVTAFVADVTERFNARDPVEEMLIAQMLWTHARVARLSVGALQQQHAKWAQLMHDAADRAANSFRRQMLALAEYRNPRRPKHFTAIGQANFAQQQLVQNHENPGTEKATNEQGSPHDNPSEAAKALPADGGGVGIPAGGQCPGEAMAVVHRPADGGGEGAGADERPEARRA